MNNSRLVLAAVLTGIVAGCGSEPGTLIITPDILPDVVVSQTVSITGTVVRTPPKSTTITVTAQGAQAVVTDTADANGVFSIEVALNANRANTIQLTAADADGSSGGPVPITIVHDGQAPVVASMTPPDGTDGATTTGNLQLTFSEAIVFGAAAAVRLITAQETIPSTAAVSADSLTLTVTPQRERRSNSVYEVHLAGIQDVVGNTIPQGRAACFVTQSSSPFRSTADSTNDMFFSGNTTGGSPSDVSAMRFGIWDTLLTGVYVFTTPRVLDSAMVNNLLAYLEIDVDQDSTTGSRTLKDTLFFSSNLNRASGIRAEYVVAIEQAGFADGYVAEYGASPFDSVTIVETFTPTFCDKFVGFSTTLAALGGDDGSFNYVVTTWNQAPPGGFLLDPMPESGHDSVRFAGLFTPPFTPLAGPQTEPSARVLTRLRTLLVPLRARQR